MKTCSRCKQLKELNEFSNKGTSTWCKICIREVNKIHYKKHKEIYAEHNKKSKDKKRKIFVFLKENKSCVKCGENHPVALDFHHIDPKQKDFNMADVYGLSLKNKEIIEKEAEKCVILCSNCHRKFHYLEKQTGITIEEYLNTKMDGCRNG